MRGGDLHKDQTWCSSTGGHQSGVLWGLLAENHGNQRSSKCDERNCAEDFGEG